MLRDGYRLDSLANLFKNLLFSFNFISFHLFLSNKFYFYLIYLLLLFYIYLILICLFIYSTMKRASTFSFLFIY